jgi:hypothetical protein
LDPTPDPAPRLQFDTAIDSKQIGVGVSERRQVTCGACDRPIADEYFDVNGTTVCASCQGEIARQAETPRGVGLLARAIAFGLVAAVLGAALYYAVIAITDFEIGIVAIAIGYMVGFSVRKGAGGAGRRFQVIALLLTYWAGGLAYVPLVIKGTVTAQREQQEAAKGGAAIQTAEHTEDGAERPAPRLGLALALLAGFSLALPVLVVIGSLPGGLLSAAIIAFGMLQAWRMTGAPQLVVTGPYRIAPDSPAVP